MADQGDEAGLPDMNNKAGSPDKDEKKSKKGKKSKKSKKVDEELSELLNSALEDFTSSGKNDETGSQNETSEKEGKPAPPNMLWDEEFMRQAALRLQQNFQSGFSAGDDTPLTAEQLGQNIQSLAEAVTQMTGSEASPDMEFSNFFAQMLKFWDVAESDPGQLSEDEIRNMLSNVGNCSDVSEFAEVLPLVLSMVQNLLSKDLIYEDVKSITEKYTPWLEENKASLPSHEYERHVNILNILREVCTELEKETPNESEEVKKARCDKLMMLLVQIRDLGSLPPEIAGDLSPMLSLDNQGFLQFPTNMSPNQCCIF